MPWTRARGRLWSRSVDRRAPTAGRARWPRSAPGSAAGALLPLGGGALRKLAGVDLTGLRPPPEGGVSCLTDVRAPLLGLAEPLLCSARRRARGQAEVAALEAGLARLAGLLGGDPAEAGAGAAGGCGYGLAAGWGAQLLPGAAELAVIAGLPAALEGADLIITGEGRYDASSESGKVVGAVRAMAAAAPPAAVPVAVVAGRVAVPPPPGVVAVELAALAEGTHAALAEPGRWLAEAGALLAAAA